MIISWRVVVKVNFSCFPCSPGTSSNPLFFFCSDGCVYIWHRRSETLIEVLPGHGPATVSVVAWNPTNERMFATCSDDHTIRIWEAVFVGGNESISEAAPPIQELISDVKGKGRNTRNVDGVNGGNRTLSSPPR